jgi:hypothetical protein
LSSPKVEHWTTTKRVLRYVKGTPDFGILYCRRKDPRLCGYTDIDWAGSIDDRKSTFGYVSSLGIGAITWTNKKQHAVALSSTEAEYEAAVKGACEAVWLRHILLDLQLQQTMPTPLFCDNQGVIKLAKNPIFHECIKHVEVHCHFIRQLVEDGSIELQYCLTGDQIADILTKALGREKYVKFLDKLVVISRLTIKGGC